VKASDLKVSKRFVKEIPKVNKTPSYGYCGLCKTYGKLVRSSHGTVVVMVCEGCKEKL
jgi:hypothetical protein